ncbi:hypothetical protein Tco_1571955, partial [Tanacetum coccineum]
MITFDSEDDCDIQEPLPPLPKLTGADLSGASKSLISLSDLTVNMADLILNTQLLLTLMEEVKGIKKQILIPSDTSSSVSQACSSKTPKQKVFYLWLNLPHYQEHTEQTAVRKSLNILKGQSSSKSTPVRTARMYKKFRECKYYESNKHHLNDCEFYPGCEICGSIAHEIADCPTLAILPTLQNSVTSEEPPEFTTADDLAAIHKPDHAESSDILEFVEPQDNILNRWSRDKHIDLVNIIGEPLAGITTRSRIRDLDVASAHECLYVNFLSETKPKKLTKALEEEGWVLAMTEELNQFERNKVWTLVPMVR